MTLRLLDTNVFSQNPKRNSLAFKALERLCMAGLVKLIVPRVVYKEFQTQQVKTVLGKFDAAVKGLESLKGLNGIAPSLADLGNRLSDELPGERAAVVAAAQAPFDLWLKSHKAELQNFSGVEMIDAMTAYFDGSPPFKEAKVRNDIPDAILYQAVTRLCAEPLVSVCDDRKLFDALAGLPNNEVVEDLAKFIERDEVQAWLGDLDIKQSVHLFRSALGQLEDEDRFLTNLVESEIGDHLAGTTVRSRSLPSDDHEGTVLSYGEADDVRLFIDDLFYVGSGEFGVPFECKVDATVAYYVFKADWYSDEELTDSVVDHNRHYFEAERQVTLGVKGMLKVKFAVEKFPKLAPMELFEDAEIDSVDRVKISED